ncbi:MAG: alpha-E domain-containing protein [Gemmatimonadetes bacterium]|nr:alpha-E domain-containing protein [Gemmatimonadota bacterium]MYC71970.1 alpha-E domain-containing protein [Gemmatimonadota bacterium]MYI62211.1 alpha-E domain-containing protein [Gemmatimonadota bacterium]
MLSRSAQGLYWMGRNIERAEHLCHLLRWQVEALVDRPLAEIHFGWNRIYKALRRQPPWGDLAANESDTDISYGILWGYLPLYWNDLTAGESDDYTLADSYTLAGDLTFERDNPNAMRNCFALGRENARQVRHCISAEMWTCLNLAWLRIRDLDIEDIWKVSPESFYAETAREINTFIGVANATMYRDEGWHFMRLGRFIERAQLLVSLLLAQFAAGREQGETEDTNWTSLLRSCQALDAYKRSYGIKVQPSRVLDLLVTNPLLPNSLCCALDAIAAELTSIGESPDAHTGAATKRLAGRLGTLIRYEWPDREDREALLVQGDEQCRKLHSLVTTAYIDYAIEDSQVQTL